jgi:hypothetical protein
MKISRPARVRHPILGLPQKADAIVRQAEPFGNGLILAGDLLTAAGQNVRQRPWFQ